MPSPDTASLPPVSADQACPACGGSGYYLLAVPLGHAEWGKLHTCACIDAARRARAIAIRHQQLAELHGQMGPILSAKTFDTFNPDRPIADVLGSMSVDDQRAQLRAALEIARQYAAQLTGWLLLYGPYGTGKSHLAAAIANTVTARGGRSAYARVPELLRFLKGGFVDNSTEARFDALRTAGLLVLDDLGTEQATPWQVSTLIELFQHRYSHMLPTVITTNLAANQIEPRIADRIDELARFVPMIAKSYRAEIRRQRAQDDTL